MKKIALCAVLALMLALTFAACEKGGGDVIEAVKPEATAAPAAPAESDTILTPEPPVGPGSPGMPGLSRRNQEMLRKEQLMKQAQEAGTMPR